MKTVLIIEDEIKTGRQIKAMIESYGGFTVAAVVPSVKGALQWLEGNAPDLIFSDIQLADGLSFEIFGKASVRAPVIFCTAYDEYAIKAFEANGIDYLLKPIDEAKLYQGLEKYRHMATLFAGNPDNDSRIDALLSRLAGGYKTTLLIHHREKIVPLKLEEVDYAHSENGIVTLYAKGGARYHVSHTLDDLEAMMDPMAFFKVNRQFIISRRAIGTAEHYFSRRLLVRLSGARSPEDIIVSKARTQAFLKWMEL